jgi:propanol-preferring alcohol dehydrogenase
MFAMVLTAPHTPLVAQTRPQPQPGPGEVRLRVLACGVCRTDLHVVDGDLAQVNPTVIPGHEIIGRVEAVGEGVTGVTPGDRLGVPWLGETCGVCGYCRDGEENLCDHPGFTGWTRDGGYADTVVARADYAFPIPDLYGDAEAAPLMCAGLIGYRAWRKACEGRKVVRLGLYGFGAAAHLLAHELGCSGAGGSEEAPPEPLDAAIIFAPVGQLVPLALQAVRKGGIVVCGGIHMSDIPAFPYAILWEERRLVSVANLTRQDARDYLPLAARAGVRAQVTTYPLAEANAALEDLRQGAFAGAAVLVP